MITHQIAIPPVKCFHWPQTRVVEQQFVFISFFLICPTAAIAACPAPIRVLNGKNVFLDPIPVEIARCTAQAFSPEGDFFR
jgi:hypothetical protein